MNPSLLFMETKVWKAGVLHILARQKLTGRTLKIMVKTFFFFSIYIKLHCDFHFTPFGLYSNTIFAALLFNTSVDLKELGYRVCGVKRG